MRFFFILPVFFILGSCYESSRDCNSFKNGTFEIESLIGTQILTTRIIRMDSLEIDYFEGKVDSSYVRWINDCEYIVKKINPRNHSEEKSIHMKILSTNTDSYIFEFKEVGKTTTKKATAKRVE